MKKLNKLKAYKKAKNIRKNNTRKTSLQHKWIEVQPNIEVSSKYMGDVEMDKRAQGNDDYEQQVDNELAYGK